MALTARGQYEYGDTDEDTRAYLREYSRTSGYLLAGGQRFVVMVAERSARVESGY